MRKFLSRGLMVAAFLSVTVPVSAMAQILTQTHPLPSCGCEKVKERTLSQELVLGPIGCSPGTPCVPGVEERLPTLKVSATGNTELHLMNPQNTTVRFNIRDLGISYSIPPNSERVIHLDPAMVASLPYGQSVTYDVSTDDACRRLAYSCIIREPYAGAITSRPFAVREEPIQAPVKKRPIRGYW